MHAALHARKCKAKKHLSLKFICLESPLSWSKKAWVTFFKLPPRTAFFQTCSCHPEGPGPWPWAPHTQQYVSTPRKATAPTKRIRAKMHWKQAESAPQPAPAQEGSQGGRDEPRKPMRNHMDRHGDYHELGRYKSPGAHDLHATRNTQCQYVQVR